MKNLIITQKISDLKNHYHALWNKEIDLWRYKIPFTRELIKTSKKLLKKTKDYGDISDLEESIFVDKVDLQGYLEEKKAIKKEMKKLERQIQKEEKLLEKQAKKE